MAVSKTEQQVQWSAANSLSISAGGNQTSDVVSFSSDAFKGEIQLKADNDGSPAAGDTVDFYIVYSLGDPDGAGAAEYDTADAAAPLARLDTNVAGGVAIKSVGPILSPGNCKIVAYNNSGGRAITVSATILEYRLS